MVFWYGPVQSDKRLDRAVQSFQQSPKKATVWTGPDRGQSSEDSLAGSFVLKEKMGRCDKFVGLVAQLRHSVRYLALEPKIC